MLEAEETEVVEPGGGDPGQGLIELEGCPRTAKAAERNIHSALLTAGRTAGQQGKGAVLPWRVTSVVGVGEV